MTLDEYKAYVEATRKESLLKAIATMSEAKVDKMTLDEYKAYVEATRKESLLKAIATMSEANDKMSSLFNTKEAE